MGTSRSQGVGRVHQRVQVPEAPAVLLELVKDRLLDVPVVESHVQRGLKEMGRKI